MTTTALPPSFAARSFGLGKPGAVVEWPERVLHALEYVEGRGGCHPASRLTWDQMIAPRARAAAAQQPAR